MGGKVLVSTPEAINKLVAARLASDVMGVSTIIIARTDANAATLLTSNMDERDQKFLTGERSSEGFYFVKNGIDQAIDRGLSYAPYADLLWCETAKPNLEEAKKFADAIHAKYPGKLLCYNCSPSFNWKENLDKDTMMTFREQLYDMGYKYQFITLAGWHNLNLGMFTLSRNYLENGMLAYSNMQEKEFESEKYGFRSTKHQGFVGTGYFDKIQNTIMQGKTDTVAMKGSTETDQFTSTNAA